MSRYNPILSTRLPAEEQPLKILSITWNMANKTPSQNDIDTILEAIPDDQRPVDAIIIAAQEEARNDKKSLAKLIKDRIYCENAYTASFDTFTEGRGRVSQSILTNHPNIRFSNTRKLQHAASKYKFKNKGGLYTDITIGPKARETTFHAAAVHLESHDNVARFEEARHIMQRMLPPIKSYDDLAKHAGTATIFAGDLNTRNKTNPNHAQQQFDTLGLSEYPWKNKSESITYSGKGTKLNDQNALSNASRPDKKRIGETKGGLLDQTLIHGNAKFKMATIVEGTTTSDHKPVVTRIDIPTVSAKNKFNVTKEFVLGEILKLKLQYITFLAENNLTVDPSKETKNLDKLYKFCDKIANNDNKENQQQLFTIYQCLEPIKHGVEYAEYSHQRAEKEKNTAIKENIAYAKASSLTKLFRKNNSQKHEEQAKKLIEDAQIKMASTDKILGYNVAEMEKQESKMNTKILTTLEAVSANNTEINPTTESLVTTVSEASTPIRNINNDMKTPMTPLSPIISSPTTQPHRAETERADITEEPANSSAPITPKALFK